MTKFYLLDDDSSVTDILEIIIDQKELGMTCGTSQSAEKALDEIGRLKPDIVIADFLMPGMDGVTFVKEAEKILPDAAFIMLSQVDSEKMISKAYEAGIEFFIRKPLNSIEVINVINNVKEKQSLKRTVDSIQNIFRAGGGVQESPETPADGPAEDRDGHRREILGRILMRLGISSEKGTDDIVKVVLYCADHEDELRNSTLKEIFGHFTDSPKSMEQRIRRTAATALSNVAHMGLNDYADETFEEFSGNLFKFDQVYKEIDYIKGRSSQHGNVQIKRFIAALVHAVNE